MHRAEFPEQNVRVGPAHVGLGVFAARQFLPTEAIGKVDGQAMDDPWHESDYCIELDEQQGFEPGPPFRYVNHSCQPNCALVYVDVCEDGSSADPTDLWVEALKTIYPGEQLTIDYAWPAEGAMPCSCGSPDCRGWIVAAEELNRIVAP